MSCKNSRIHLFALHFRLSVSFSFLWDKKSAGKLATESISEIKKQKNKYVCNCCFCRCCCFQLSSKRWAHFRLFTSVFTAIQLECISTWLYLLSREIHFLFTHFCVFVYHATRYLFMRRAFCTCSAIVIFKSTIESIVKTCKYFSTLPVL